MCLIILIPSQFFPLLIYWFVLSSFKHSILLSIDYLSRGNLRYERVFSFKLQMFLLNLDRLLSFIINSCEDTGEQRTVTCNLISFTQLMYRQRLELRLLIHQMHSFQSMFVSFSLLGDNIEQWNHTSYCVLPIRVSLHLCLSSTTSPPHLCQIAVIWCLSWPRF